MRSWLDKVEVLRDSLSIKGNVLGNSVGVDKYCRDIR